MNYPLLAYCNRRNAEELAKPREARALGTLEWVPPNSSLLVSPELHWRLRSAFGFVGTGSLGRGDKISCGHVVRAADEIVGGPAAIARVWAKNSNVCRPFSESHVHPLSIFSGDRFIEWRSLENGFCELEERVILDDVFTTQNIDTLARFFFFEAITCTADLNADTRELRRRTVFSDIVVCHIPPNHGHDSVCPCAKWSARLLPNLPDQKRDRISVQIDHACRVVLAVSKAEAVERQAQATQFKAGNVELPWPKHTECPYELIAKSKGNCKWCEGTGRVVCDQDGRGNQAQHRVSKTMAKARRRYYRIKEAPQDAALIARR